MGTVAAGLATEKRPTAQAETRTRDEREVVQLSAQGGCTSAFGGGGGGKSSSYWGSYAGEGAPGTVRVIWGPGRAFPTTNVGEDYLGFNELSYFNPSAPPDP